MAGLDPAILHQITGSSPVMTEVLVTPAFAGVTKKEDYSSWIILR